MRWFWLLGLTLAAWEDLRSREFPYWIFWFWLIPGLGNVVTDSVWKHLGAASVGTGMLLVSRVTGGALGAGDGLFFLLSACYLDLQETVLLFLMALGISCLWSMTAVLRDSCGRKDYDDPVSGMRMAARAVADMPLDGDCEMELHSNGKEDIHGYGWNSAAKQPEAAAEMPGSAGVLYGGGVLCYDDCDIVSVLYDRRCV